MTTMRSVTPLPNGTLPEGTGNSDTSRPSALEKLREYSDICLMDDEYDTAGVFYPDYTVATTAAIARAVRLGGDYRGLLGKECREAQSTPGTLAERTEHAMASMYLDWAREMNVWAQKGVLVDISPTAHSCDDIIHHAQETARQLMEHGMREDRFMVSVPATIEGLRAVRSLAGVVRCNATCVYSLAQAVLAADAGACAVSVGVGDVSDHWRWKTGREAPAWEDRGVLLCSSVQMTLRTLEYTGTATVAAGCRTVAQVLELAGADCIALAPWMVHALARRDAADVYEHLPHHARIAADQYMLRPATLTVWPQDATELLRQERARTTECFNNVGRTVSNAIAPFVRLEA